MPNYDKLIELAHNNVELLSKKINELDKLYKDIEDKKKIAEGIPVIFNAKFEEISKLSVKYTDELGKSTKTYLDGNNKLFTVNLNDLKLKTEAFQNEIERIKSTDFTKMFAELQKVFIEQTKKDIAIELEKIEKKADDFQNKIDALQKEIVRLEKIDLKKGFNDLQDTLSKIFNAINSINGTLTSITGTLNNIVTTLGSLQTSISEGFNNTIKNINKLESNILDELIQAEGNNKNRFDSIDTQFTAIDKDLKSQFEKINTTIDSIVNQNNLLNKEIKTNRIILFIGSVISFCLLLYLGFFK